MKSDCFWHVLFGISAIWEYIDVKFCTHIHQSLIADTWYVFCENFDFELKILKRKKHVDFFESFRKYQFFLKIRGRNFVALLILSHFISVN